MCFHDHFCKSYYNVLHISCDFSLDINKHKLPPEICFVYIYTLNSKKINIKNKLPNRTQMCKSLILITQRIQYGHQ